MLARELLRSDPERVRRAFADRRQETASLDAWQELDRERRERLTEVEELKRRRNEASQAIGRLKGRGEDAAAEIAAVATLKSGIEELDSRIAAIDAELATIELRLPNLPHDSVPRGEDERANRIERQVGEPRRFDFAPQAHWDLGPALGILDFERGAKLSGARFTASFGAGAALERGLVAFMLDLHVREHAYTEVLPPYLVNAAALTGTGQLPKFEADLFRVAGEDLYLIPTAEVPVTNLHRGEVIDESDLPVRYAAFSPCFRSEAGSYGKDVRGLIRQHQFHKVELVHLATPETSYAELETMVFHAGRVLERLGIPYRVVCLSTGDMGFSAAKTYDLEVWLPGQNAWREISSCSNCEDFQARRADLRYRPAGGKPRLLHTLNGSGLAVGRTLIAVLENFQNADGTVTVPEALRPFVGGLERITARRTVGRSK
ncbi:MAG: serine--tRNA ligase [Thermoanaerobaculia bacterium]|nr:MAG: serine--tRNA ligase [Thermoanaerobaculia bacterium]MBZ0102251.1 serine--tRNA ligase [Thermoanaerobaculia bacterium]